MILYIYLSFIFPWSSCKIKISVYLSQSSINHRSSSDQTQSDRFRLWTPVFTNACVARVKLASSAGMSANRWDIWLYGKVLLLYSQQPQFVIWQSLLAI